MFRTLHRNKNNGSSKNVKNVNGFSSRIPSTLQAVFLASNRGANVKKAPPMQVASRAFRTLFTRPEFYNPEADDNPATEQVYQEPANEDVVVEEPEDLLKHPQDYLDQLLASRGYSIESHSTLDTAFYNKPTALQQASYSRHLQNTAKAGNHQDVIHCIKAGLSPNPCNSFGESLLHMVCRLGDAPLLQGMIASGTSLCVADDYGRTILHDACWAAKPAFETVDTIIETLGSASMFYLKDCRGSRPLAYVHAEHYPAWIKFIQANKDKYWPVERANEVDPRITGAPNSFILPDPKEALTLEMAQMVSSGRMTPDEALLLKCNGDDNTDDETFSDESESDYDSSDYSDSDYSDSDYDINFNHTNVSFEEDDLLADEMAMLLKNMTSEAARM